MRPLAVPTPPIARRIATLVAIVYVGMAWWPLRADLPTSRPNGAVRDGAAVRFEQPGELRGDGSALLAAIRASRGCVVDLVFTPTTSTANGPARILELGSDHDRMNLMVGQAGADLVVRIRRPGSDLAGAPPLIATGVLTAAKPAHATITIAPDRLAVAVDGRTRDELPLSTAPIDAWDETCALRLGDSPAGGRPWLGSIERVDVSAGPAHFDLLAPDVLERPVGIWSIPERLRLSADWYGFAPAGWQDLVVNLLGFVPLGLLAALGWRDRPAWSAACFGLAVSLLMETGQIAVVDRVPSMLDVLLNSTGAIAGGCYVRWRLADRPSVSDRPSHRGACR